MAIKEAVENAMVFAQATLGPERMTGARLEEIESTSAGSEDAWLITLSMQDDPYDFIGTGRRAYKAFTVLKSSGEVTSMKIRELAA